MNYMFNNKVMIGALLIANILLTACGGTGGSFEDAGVQGVSYRDLSSLNFDLERASARIAQVEGNTSNLPVGGTANYLGTAEFKETNLTILAGAALEASFSSASTFGTLFNFRGSDGTVFNGTLDITNGKIDRTDSTIIADIAGNLTSDSAAMQTISVSGPDGFNGRILGDNYTYVRGPTSVTWVTNEGTDTEESRTMTGELTVQNQN